MTKHTLTKAGVIARYLPDTLETLASAEAFAPSNIALCKYWGKRQKELNLPINSSLSISLAHLGTRTKLSVSTSGADQILLNDEAVDMTTPFAVKIVAFIDLFRRQQALPLLIETYNNIPTAAGLASSASGFAALTLAINRFFNLSLSDAQLSAFARMGSGSASRSIFDGFVEWRVGEDEDGMDSHAHLLNYCWPELRVGLVKVSTGPKAVDSRSGMGRTLDTATLYESWPKQAENDLQRMHQALAAGCFESLGAVAEHNAMSMHATMIASWPPLLYWQPESVAAMQKVWALRSDGVSVYLTMDAGPNLKLLFLKDSESDIRLAFPELEVIAPFSGDRSALSVNGQ